jgi:hypothetical protein
LEPFKVSAELRGLSCAYPDAKTLADAAVRGGELSKLAIARLWLSEGIPYAFKDNPALYETVRGWLSTKLSVDPKEIHLTGSARLGQSMAPDKLGKIFGQNSDLDLFVVSQNLFEKITADFNAWAYDFEKDNILPRNDRENTFWVSNLQRGPKNIQRGFIDTNTVPNFESYATTKNVSQAMWLLKEKLDVTDNAPRVKGASVRCYRDWACYVRQMVTSLS